MKISIVLSGCHRIELDKSGKFNCGDTKVSIKEVPFVRYRFEQYTEKEIEYIGKMLDKFKFSTHLAEIQLSDKSYEELTLIKSKTDSVATYIYVPITDEVVANGLSDETISMIEKANMKEYDRVMLKDNSSTLYNVPAIKIKKVIAGKTGVDYRQIGICSSPLSFNEGEACINAVRARRLSAEYARSYEVALPSANHECMNECGCIRHYEIRTDVLLSESDRARGKRKSGRTSSSNSDGTDAGDKRTKKNKVRSFVKWR